MDAIQGNQIQTANDRAIEHHDLVDVEHIILGWILVIIIGLIFSGAGSSITSNSYFSFVKSFLLNSGSFILVYPGPIIFPIIAGAIIGREIGKGSNNLKNASKSGLMNGFYGAIIYLLAVVVVYVVMNYFSLISFSAIFFTVIQNVIAPVAILILTTIGFASISHIRKINV